MVMARGHEDNELDELDIKLLENLVHDRRTRILVDGVVRKHFPETGMHVDDLLHLLELCGKSSTRRFWTRQVRARPQRTPRFPS